MSSRESDPTAPASPRCEPRDLELTTRSCPPLARLLLAGSTRTSRSTSRLRGASSSGPSSTSSPVRRPLFPSRAIITILPSDLSPGADLTIYYRDGRHVQLRQARDRHEDVRAHWPVIVPLSSLDLRRSPLPPTPPLLSSPSLFSPSLMFQTSSGVVGFLLANFATGPGVTGWIMTVALGIMVWYAMEKRRRAPGKFERFWYSHHVSSWTDARSLSRRCGGRADSFRLFCHPARHSCSSSSSPDGSSTGCVSQSSLL